ncbi:hypothetical protein [Tenacibaculum sp. SDUM215027]|uniref:hypothetical protein n=1 Tax=Tenacibaculum sp. SDUM215027 TaxID=3422596 RepID=UPI003D317D3A
MTKNKIYNLFILILFLVSCKNQKPSFKEKKEEQKIVEKTADVVAAVKDNSTLIISQIQGVWQGEKDLNQSESYRIIKDNNVLDLTCIEGVCDEENLFYQTGKIGFTNDSKSNQVEAQDQGDFLIYETYDEDLKNNKVKFDDKFEFDEDLSLFKTSLVSSYMVNEDDESQQFSFVKKHSLPFNLFKVIKSISKSKEEFNLIKEFDIAELSSKVVVNVPKSYFYVDENLEVKKRAFLIQNDKAYLEEINNNSVKVYFDGIKITSGYLKKSEVIILQD